MTKNLEGQLRKLKMEDIALAKQIIEEREYELWEPMWWTHEMDEWLYVLYYDDGKTHLTHKGKEAYETYCEDERIYLIMRKTKHLFPLWEVVLERSVNGENPIRHKLHESELPGLPLAT